MLCQALDEEDTRTECEAEAVVEAAVEAAAAEAVFEAAAAAEAIIFSSAPSNIRPRESLPGRRQRRTMEIMALPTEIESSLLGISEAKIFLFLLFSEQILPPDSFTESAADLRAPFAASSRQSWDLLPPLMTLGAAKSPKKKLLAHLLVLFFLLTAKGILRRFLNFFNLLRRQSLAFALAFVLPRPDD